MTAPHDWTVEDLQQLRDDDQPATELVPTWTQSAWDRRQVAQLRAAETAHTRLWDFAGHQPDSVLVRDALLDLGYTQAAHEHMEATRHEDERSFFAALCREYDARVIEPTAVHTPGKRRKPTPPRGEGGRFLPKGGTS